MQRRWQLAAILLAAALASVAYFTRNRPLVASKSTVEADTGYVNPQLCAGCHANIWGTYAKTAMARSFYRPAPGNSIEDYTKNTFYHKKSNSYFQMIQRDGKYYQRRYQIGFEGKEANILEKEIHFIMGSGSHVRTYLHRTSRDTLIQLPLAWYAENGGRWAMNPGYDRPDHPGFQRRVTNGCMFCHNSYPEIPPASDAAGAEPVFSGRLPQGIDCQRCHGPGRKHVQAAGIPDAKIDGIRAAIVNPSRLSNQAQMEVCLQCHLETTSFRLPNAIVRYERGPFSYRPGEPLSDFVLHFDHAPGKGREDKFEIVSAGYRLRRSACFQNSDGALRCTTCHNPHSTPRKEEATQLYATACRQCHGAVFNRSVASGKHTASPDCVGCHMPKRRTEDVVHVVMTDHYIQRRKPARDLLAEIPERHETDDNAYRGEVVPYYPQKLTGAPEKELYLGIAQVSQKSNLVEGIAQLTAALEKHRPQRAEFYLELADAWRNSGQLEKALPLYEEAVRRQPGFVAALRKLGVGLRTSGQHGRAAEILRRALEAAPDDATSWHELGLVHLQQGQRDAAMEALRKAINLDPDIPEAHNSLGGISFESGDRAKAEAAFRNAIQIQPHYAEAHSNLGNLLSASGDFAQARYHFEAALRYQPTYAAARYNYGVALIRVRRLDEAKGQMEAALRANPNLAEAHDLLGSLLVAKGQLRKAIHHYREAVRIQPQSARAHLGLGATLVQSGDPAGAPPHLRQAAKSSEPSVREEAIQLLQQLGMTP